VPNIRASGPEFMLAVRQKRTSYAGKRLCSWRNNNNVFLKVHSYIIIIRTVAGNGIYLLPRRRRLITGAFTFQNYFYLLISVFLVVDCFYPLNYTPPDQGIIYDIIIYGIGYSYRQRWSNDCATRRGDADF
jgi:hypothetical protein